MFDENSELELLSDISEDSIKEYDFLTLRKKKGTRGNNIEYVLDRKFDTNDSFNEW